MNHADPAPEGRNPAPGDGSIGLEVDDVRRRMPELAARGLQFAADPYPLPGGHAANLRDPDGNRLIIADQAGARSRK